MFHEYGSYRIERFLSAKVTFNVIVSGAIPYSTQQASTDAGDKHLNVGIYVTQPNKKLHFTYFIHTQT